MFSKSIFFLKKIKKKFQNNLKLTQGSGKDIQAGNLQKEEK